MMLKKILLSMIISFCCFSVKTPNLNDSMNREPATAVLVDFCHTKLKFQEEKDILGPSLGKSKTSHVAKNSNLTILWSEK